MDFEGSNKCLIQIYICSDRRIGRPGVDVNSTVPSRVTNQLYLWLKVVKPMVADTKATAQAKVVLPQRRRVNTLDTPMEKN